MDASDISALLCRVKIASAFVRELGLTTDGDKARAARTLDHLTTVERDLSALRDEKLRDEARPVPVHFPARQNIIALPTLRV